jgi:nitric oxide reductase activation protein
MEYTQKHIKTAIANRLTGLVRTVGRDKDISLTFGDGVAQGFPAMTKIDAKQVFIDANNPREEDMVRALILHKAKLYHELAHLKHTTHESERQRFAARSRNRDAFLAISNILEDGRIERLFVSDFPGTAPYFAYILSYFSPDGQPLNDLVFRVRSDRYAHESTRQYFATVEHLITQALEAANTHEVMVAAEAIVNALPQTEAKPQQDCYSKPQKDATPEQQEQAKQSNSQDDDSQDDDEDDGQEQNGKAASDSEESDETGDSKDGSDVEDESEGESDEMGDASGEDGDSDGGDDEQEASHQGKGNASGAGGEEEEHEDKPVTGEAARQQIISELSDYITAELEEELGSVVIEIQNRNKAGQKFLNGTEAQEAAKLTQVFKQLQTQAKRENWKPAYRTGRIDSRRITNVVTGGSFLKRRGQSLDKRPAVVTLIDNSASMSSKIGRATEAARIVNGAILNAKLDSAVITFGTHVKQIGEVPLTMTASESSTKTATALKEAHKVLKTRPEPRKLVIIITDGCPDFNELCIMPKVRDDLTRDGIYVAAVILGFGNPPRATLPFASFCDSIFYEPESLSQQLTDLLLDFTR